MLLRHGWRMLLVQKVHRQPVSLFYFNSYPSSVFGATEPHALMLIASLETSLDRVDGAVASLLLPL